MFALISRRSVPLAPFRRRKSVLICTFPPLASRNMQFRGDGCCCLSLYSIRCYISLSRFRAWLSFEPAQLIGVIARSLDVIISPKYGKQTGMEIGHVAGND